MIQVELNSLNLSLLVLTIFAGILTGSTIQWVIDQGVFNILWGKYQECNRSVPLSQPSTINNRSSCSNAQYYLIVLLAACTSMIQTSTCLVHVLMSPDNNYGFMAYSVFNWVFMTHSSVMLVSKKLSCTFANPAQAWRRLLWINYIMLPISIFICFYWVTATTLRSPWSAAVATVAEPIQIALWGAIEFALSGAFIVKMWKFHWTTVERQGIWVLVLVGLCDICTVLANLIVGDLPSTCIKGFVYCLRIRLEISVLNAMVDAVRQRKRKVEQLPSIEDIEEEDEEAQRYANLVDATMMVMIRHENELAQRIPTGIPSLTDLDHPQQLSHSSITPSNHSITSSPATSTSLTPVPIGGKDQALYRLHLNPQAAPTVTTSPAMNTRAHNKQQQKQQQPKRRKRKQKTRSMDAHSNVGKNSLHSRVSSITLSDIDEDAVVDFSSDFSLSTGNSSSDKTDTDKTPMAPRRAFSGSSDTSDEERGENDGGLHGGENGQCCGHGDPDSLPDCTMGTDSVPCLETPGPSDRISGTVSTSSITLSSPNDPSLKMDPERTTPCKAPSGTSNDEDVAIDSRGDIDSKGATTMSGLHRKQSCESSKNGDDYSTTPTFQMRYNSSLQSMISYNAESLASPPPKVLSRDIDQETPVPPNNAALRDVNCSHRRSSDGSTCSDCAPSPPLRWNYSSCEEDSDRGVMDDDEEEEDMPGYGNGKDEEALKANVCAHHGAAASHCHCMDEKPHQPIRWESSVLLIESDDEEGGVGHACHADNEWVC